MIRLKTESFESWNTAVYFSIATYTTLGYGDVVLDEGHRIFAAFGAMTGMLAFGISTAFLVGTMRPVSPAGAAACVSRKTANDPSRRALWLTQEEKR